MNLNRRSIVAALALSASASLLSIGPISASASGTVPSHNMQCGYFQRSPRQLAQAANMRFIEKHWTRLIYGNTCVVSYDGPKVPNLVLLKDEIARLAGGAYGAVPLVGQVGDRFHAGNNITICTLNSRKGRFVDGPVPSVKWSQLKDYIRKSGESQGIDYWTGKFWSENESTLERPDIHYSGPSRKWVIPDEVFVIKPHGKRIPAGYLVQGTNYTIRSDWYFFC